MSLFHEAYLFHPDAFAHAVMPRVEELQTIGSGYNLLRVEAIRLYEVSLQVRTLADEHGGWDREGITTAFPEREPAGAADAAFWITLLLYGHLVPLTDRRLGLTGYWETLDNVLIGFGWGDARRRLLIEGRNFDDLARAWTNARAPSYAGEEVDPTLWDHLSWGLQSGRVGWLSDDDTRILLQDLIADEPKLSTRPASLIPSETHRRIQGGGQMDAQMREAYRLAIEMLTVAQKEQCGLCLIIAG